MQTAHHALMVLGLSALATLALMFVRPDITDHLKALSPFNRTQLAQEPATVSPDMASLMDTPSKPFTKTKANEKITVNQVVFHGIDGKYADATDEQRIVASWISKRYRVAGDATLMLVHNAYQIADELKLDPLLILSVAAIESSFNPFAESAVGAQGLMQVMSKLHHEKFQSLGGVKAALNPVANMKVGALILKDYVQRGGSVEAGLKMYVGAAAFNTDYGYGSKVLSEYRRLREVAGRTAPPLPATANKTEPKSTTSNGAVEQKISAPEEDKSA
ncbi:MAG: transglycosylase SLT domain-containing protein [Proteobacteria bacterium]|nr:transglycosylase SLT domain-containing protein [Pseudomonadota bacterium]